ncbi:SAM-dependent methyltransferase [Allonocardiopsis opalescens]|uniref:Methyltransferase family protein n=1 Tax=Allonocardiopsis opalescens TaxID=1144618 RepID=A0A2T0QEF8_9ACTN|nr:class I SAM-dependent methyltransferase [Allonocardiopsis opalescens]PRY02334.1 methyltransferase family protein [Allonocardiopsis opalescens]
MSQAHGEPPRLTRLDFHGPLSADRAARMVERLARTAPRTVADIGCGWGELMLRLLAAVPEATGLGIDLREDDLARGRALAERRGLGARAVFSRGPAAATALEPADVVLCLGASHALSDAAPPQHTAGALRALRRLVRPGGRVLFGEGFWERTPTAGELAAMWPGATAEDHLDLAGLVDAAAAAGFRPEWIERAGRDEWDAFESGYLAGVEEWLAADPARPGAAEARERADRHRSSWLRGYRDVLGMAYLTLVPAG